MPFVAIGAPGIEVLQPPEVRRRMLAEIEPGRVMTCYQWNWFFAQATGVMGPASQVCSGEVGFEKWFEWLLKQR